MWMLPITRRDLVDLLTPRREDNVAGVVEDPFPSLDGVRGDRMAALWPMRPAEFGRMPTAIIVPDSTLRDSLAWLATYVRDFRPFTAFCRVVEKSTAEQFLNGHSSPHLKSAEGVCSGLILGESLARTHGMASFNDVPAVPYSATLSHAIGRSLALLGAFLSLDSIEGLWSQARGLTGQNAPDLPPAAILYVWAVALGMPTQATQPKTLFDSFNALGKAWLELSAIGEISDLVWRRLVDGFPDLEPMRSIVELPREHRVEMIDFALRLLASSRKDADERRAFLAGYFASLLAPGSLDHAEILAPMASAFPTAYLWYGLCAGVNVRGESLPTGNSLARRIVRDLTVPDRLIDRPRCDLAIDEMALFDPVNNPLRLTTKAGQLDIDILPGVTTSFRWPAHDITREIDLRRSRDMEMQQILMGMEETTARWRFLTERLKELISGTASRQSSPPRKRGGKS